MRKFIFILLLFLVPSYSFGQYKIKKIDYTPLINNIVYGLQNNSIFWQGLYEKGYMGKNGDKYFLTLPITEKFSSDFLCFEVEDTTLLWFCGRKFFAWEGNEPREPIEIEYTEYTFEKGKEVKEKKLPKLKTDGKHELSDIYNNLKGSTLKLKDRKKQKISMFK